jgi:hypothetical protein
MGNCSGQAGLSWSRLLPIIAVIAAVSLSGLAAGQEFRPDKDYVPNDYEKALIDRIKATAKPDTSAMEFILRMPFAIETACKALVDPTAEAIDSVMEYAGGHHKVICRQTMEKLREDSAIVTDIMASISRQGHFAVKTVDLPKGVFLVVYWSDLAFMSPKPGGSFGYGGTEFPGDPDFFRIGLSGKIPSDSLKYVVYRGTSSIIIPKDSVVQCTSFATVSDCFSVDVEFEKKRFDIWTVNLYALDRMTKKFDLIETVIPAIVVNRPPTEEKR